MTLTEENYIKSIYQLGRYGTMTVSTNSIAEALETKASSVTDMVKKLAEKGYANYKRYQGVSLTSQGKKIASDVVRKHRLWEVFLVEKLNFTWDEVHDIAEQLEHIKSEKLINELDKLLDFPTHDPHGDPIPDKNGDIKKTDKILLFNLAENNKGVCVGVKDTSSSFLKYLDKHKIALGSEITVVSREDFDDSMVIQINGVTTMSISQAVANNLFVKEEAIG
ncbi:MULTISPECIES: metal-dependent transcriptional regulator [Aestuariibaculum]|uniref:Transcriptional regulator MntR n=1 Tax=Aestuariibaculum lutulentum TaxID=2920935 RepID=A0ABS9RGD1_9FLAO|nr:MULTISPECIES: metal-dependent transcriptional regulator [Aestuariibaculum]MCH4552006.1 metal-dependent transcriptional regulator [Aestuariibaculum lutulentum]MCR8667099.1 metal-dependent transcriptional regulator [Aestuariibaculum sp. M13]